MREKFKMIILILFVALICGGCANADTTRDIRHSGFSLAGTEFECPMLLPSNSDYEKTKYLTSTQAITSDGTVYLLSLTLKYSNELNCMKANFSHKVTSIFDSVAKADDGKLYYLTANGENAAFSEVTSNNSNYALYKLVLDDTAVIKVITVDQESGHYYVLKDDGNVYNYVIPKSSNFSSIASTSIVYAKSEYGGEIIDFNYVGKITGTFIRTNSQIFRMVATNKDECTKYADIKCEYDMKKDEGLSKHLDKILGFDGRFLLTTYGKEFNVAG